jgi:hypothetical protein
MSCELISKTGSGTEFYLDGRNLVLRGHRGEVLVEHADLDHVVLAVIASVQSEKGPPRSDLVEAVRGLMAVLDGKAMTEGNS